MFKTVRSSWPLAILFSILVITSEAHPSDGSIAHYPFDGDVNDVTLNRNDGQIVGQPRFERGVLEGAVRLSYGNAVSIPSLANLSASNLSVSVWFKAEQLTGQMRLVCKQSTASGHESWGVEIVGNTLWFHSGNGLKNDNLASTNALAMDRFYHAVAVNDGVTKKLFLNGVEIAQNASLGNVFRNTAPVTIGYTPTDGEFYFNGLIDDVRLYERALTHVEIRELFKLGDLPPRIISGTGDQVAFLGEKARLTVEVSSVSPVRFKWYLNGLALADATSQTLELYEATRADAGYYSCAISNDRGSVLANVGRLVVLDDPAQGKPAARPTTRLLPPRETGKDDLIFITHGWSVPWKPLPTRQEWIERMTANLQSYLISNGLSSWQVIPHSWVEDSHEELPDLAAIKATQIGMDVGRQIGSQGWKHVHLIGHSAGAALIQSATEAIKVLNPGIVVHETFLDAYLQVGYPGRKSYGRLADWADSVLLARLSDGHLVQFTAAAVPNRRASGWDIQRRRDPSRPLVRLFAFNWF
ncbi:MAG: LamG-like jellyroll fold domain-containing protein [Verrucomicrobiia bacterium]